MKESACELGSVRFLLCSRLQRQLCKQLPNLQLACGLFSLKSNIVGRRDGLVS